MVTVDVKLPSPKDFRRDRLRRCRSAATAIGDRLYIRRLHAHRLVGIVRVAGTSWEDRGWVKPLRRGREVWYPAVDVFRVWVGRTSNSRRRWGDDEQSYLLEHAGVYCTRLIARRLRRSRLAVLSRIQRLGLTIRGNQGLLSLGQVASLLGRHPSTIRAWKDRGLYMTRMRGGHACLYVSVDHLRRFLRRRPNILAGIDPFARRRLKLSIYDLEDSPCRKGA